MVNRCKHWRASTCPLGFTPKFPHTCYPLVTPLPAPIASHHLPSDPSNPILPPLSSPQRPTPCTQRSAYHAHAARARPCSRAFVFAGSVLKCKSTPAAVPQLAFLAHLATETHAAVIPPGPPFPILTPPLTSPLPPCTERSVYHAHAALPPFPGNPAPFHHLATETHAAVLPPFLSSFLPLLNLPLTLKRPPAPYT